MGSESSEIEDLSDYSDLPEASDFDDPTETPEELAPLHELPDRELFVIEYPGVVKNFDRAMVTLGGQPLINKVLLVNWLGLIFPLAVRRR